MRIISKKGRAKVDINDKQMSAIMSALAVATVRWDELKDPEVTTTKDDLQHAGLQLVESYMKANGVSKKEMVAIFAKLSVGEDAVL